MVQHKTLDQYLHVTSDKVSTSYIKCFRRYRLLKTLTKNFIVKSLSMTLTSRSLTGVGMVQHNRLEQHPTSGKESASSIK